MFDTVLWSKYVTWKDFLIDVTLPLSAGIGLALSGWACTAQNLGGAKLAWIPLLVLGLTLTVVLLGWTMVATYPGEANSAAWGRLARKGNRILISTSIGLPFILTAFFAGYVYNTRLGMYAGWCLLVSAAAVFYLAMVGWMPWCHRLLNFWVDAREWSVGEGRDAGPSPWANVFWNER